MYMYKVFIHIHMYMYVAHPFRSYFGPRSTTLYMYIYIYTTYTRLSWFSGLSQRPCTTAFAFVSVRGAVPTAVYNGVHSGVVYVYNIPHIHVCLGSRVCPNDLVQRLSYVYTFVSVRWFVPYGRVQRGTIWGRIYIYISHTHLCAY